MTEYQEYKKYAHFTALIIIMMTECQEGLVCLVQCTSPFLSPHYLHQGLQMIAKYDSVFAAVRSHALRWNLNSEYNSM